MATTPEFYAEARRLTAETGTLLLIDSIQAGLRAHGMLSIVDYPGFETLDAPDMETYSKALNAGQYPLSVLALNEKTAKMYAKGVYGNTMTCNPRALEVACTVLDQLTPDVRANISDRGQEMVDALKALQEELPERLPSYKVRGFSSAPNSTAPNTRWWASAGLRNIAESMELVSSTAVPIPYDLHHTSNLHPKRSTLSSPLFEKH